MPSPHIYEFSLAARNADFYKVWRNIPEDSSEEESDTKSVVYDNDAFPAVEAAVFLQSLATNLIKSGVFHTLNMLLRSV